MKFFLQAEYRQAEVKPEMNFQSKAILSMQETSSACLIGHIVDTNVCAIYDMHVTIMVKDMQSTLVCAVGECVCV